MDASQHIWKVITQNLNLWGCLIATFKRKENPRAHHKHHILPYRPSKSLWKSPFRRLHKHEDKYNMKNGQSFFTFLNVYTMQMTR